LLGEILAKSPFGHAHADLIVGNGSSDDAAVYRLNDRQALIATTDFFAPIVDDPFDYGRIAATNALSDVYAMGGRPILALALLGVPAGKVPVEVVQRILAGGQAVCDTAGIPIAGGHSIDAPEPFYGLVALGLVDPGRVKRNDRAQPGDVLILGKGLGIGILGAALRKGELSREAYAELIQCATRLNTVGADLGALEAVHALTDVTGFGLAGHLLEVLRGSGLGGEISFAALPLLPAAAELARAGHATGASARNWQSFGGDVLLPTGFPDWQRNVLTDPQTSGGLLVSCAPDAERTVLGMFHAQGFHDAATIGRAVAGSPTLRVR
jgi:selenide,water dikinase